ncbi:histidine ammonia-lyase, partial [Bacillus salipaludis]
AHQIIQNARRVLAIELICAMQAVEYRGVDKMATQTRRLYEKGREIVPSIKKDRIFSKDIEKAAEALKTIDLTTFIQQFNDVK